MIIPFTEVQKMVVLSVVLLVCLTEKGEAITRFPPNAAIVAGQEVIFNCRSESNNSSVWWKYNAAGSKTSNILFNSKNLTGSDCDNCSINNSAPGQYDLRITNTRQSHAGTYICVENNGTEENASKADGHAAELIVLASVPECGSNLTGSNASLLEDNVSVRMWCKVQFRGNIAPVMEWRNKATDETISSLITQHRNSKVESEITVKLKHDDNRGMAYSCRTYFNQSFSESLVSEATVAKNTPDYSYTWTSDNGSRKQGRPTLDSQEHSTKQSHHQPNHETFSILMTTALIILTIFIISIVFFKLSSKGCFKKISPAGPNTISQANTAAYPDIFYEDPLAGATSPGDGHVYSLEPAQNSNLRQNGHLQNEIPSITTGARTHPMVHIDGGEVQSDEFGSIGHREERQAVMMNVRSPTRRPTFDEGRDGTVYTEVNMRRGGGHVIAPIQQATPVQSLFSRSVYAPIDHTAAPMRVSQPASTTRR